VNASLRQLFSEIVDLPPAKRRLILGRRGIAADLCAELESLLEYDAPSGPLASRVSEVMKEAFGPSDDLPKCGPYRLLRLLGSGGMGSVYLAQRDDGEIDQHVAIKLLRADTDRPAWRERFLRERQVLAFLNHPSIARLIDAGHTADGRPYLVMEFVEGLPLEEYARTLDLRSRLELFVQVCEAVSHAHRLSIIHRDLKPSNILVDRSGRAKLLDFGIAKVLNAKEQTQTGDRLLTPTYASPEQLRGTVQNAATDIYSLGAVLYKLLSGCAHRESATDELAWGRDENLVPPSRLKPDLPKDIDYIVLKALRFEPAERYLSAEALADDIRRFLDSRPVRARSGDVPYRIYKFVRRNRAAAAAAIAAIGCVFATTTVANQRRNHTGEHIQQARRLATRVLALKEASGDLHGSSRTGYELVKLSKDYIEGLASDARGDPSLALQLGQAYALLARTEGITLTAPDGQWGKAKESLRKAGTLVEPVLRARPYERETLLTVARISHDQMVMAETEHRSKEAIAHARKTVDYLEKLFACGGLTADQSAMASDWFYQIALTHKNLQRFDEGIRFSRRSIEISRSLPGGAYQVSLGLSLLADLLRLTGNLDGAHEAIREAHGVMQGASFPSEVLRRSSWITLLWREGKILGAANGLDLNRPAEAIAVLQNGFELLKDWAQTDPLDTWSRLVFASVGRELGELLRVESPQRALSIYDDSLRRLREVRDNAEARRGEVVMLAGSAYALRRLGRVEEAGRQIESAFQILRNLGQYPSADSSPNATVETALRALGDHLAETGQPRRAADVLEDLLSRLERSKPEPRNNLRHAIAVSQIYGALSSVYRAGGQPDRADSLAARRIALWREWDRKLPANTVIRRQLEHAGS
jgi:serine/threonine protein kinase